MQIQIFNTEYRRKFLKPRTLKIVANCGLIDPRFSKRKKESLELTANWAPQTLQKKVAFFCGVLCSVKKWKTIETETKIIFFAL